MHLCTLFILHFSLLLFWDYTVSGAKRCFEAFVGFFVLEEREREKQRCLFFSYFFSPCIGDSANNSNQWVRNKKNVDKEKAKSLTYIDSGIIL